MEYKASFTYSRPHLRKTLMRHWWQNYGRPYSFWISVPLLALVGCLLDGDFDSSGKGGIVFGLLIGVTGSLLFFFFDSSSKFKKGADASIRRLDGVVVCLSFTESELCMETPTSTNHYKWQAFKKLLLTEESWELFSVFDKEISLPISMLSDDIMEFLMQKIRDAGGLVVRRR